MIRELHNTKSSSFCAVCEFQLPPNAIFCPNCDPPLPPEREPEEIGITLGQALLRISILVILFIAILVSRLDLSVDKSISGIINENIDLSRQKSNLSSKDFHINHTVTASAVNIRSEPSVNSRIIITAKQGVKLEILDKNKLWSKVNVLGKTGWISNKFFKSEIISP